MNRKITIRDVAEAAGVSISSVHLALNGKKGVGEETRQHIQEIAEQLGYRPNVLASSLKRKRRTIVIALPDERGNNRYFYPPIWKGIHDFMEQQLDAADYIELPYSDENELEVKAELKERIAEKQIDALLTVGHIDLLDDEDWQRMELNEVLITFVNSERRHTKYLTCVEPYYDVIGRTMAELMTSRITSYGSFFLCAGNPKYLSHALVVRGFDAYLMENHLQNLVYKDFSWTMEETNYIHILRELMRPDIAACGSVFSQGTILLGRALEESGKADKLYAVGSDLSQETIERLNAGVINNVIQKNPYAQGFMGLRSLVDYFNGSTPPEKIYVGADVVFKSNLAMYEGGTSGVMLM